MWRRQRFLTRGDVTASVVDDHTGRLPPPQSGLVGDLSLFDGSLLTLESNWLFTHGSAANGRARFPPRHQLAASAAQRRIRKFVRHAVCAFIPSLALSSEC